jgi:hypothetical protein
MLTMIAPLSNPVRGLGGNMTWLPILAFHLLHAYCQAQQTGEGSAHLQPGSNMDKVQIW